MLARRGGQENEVPVRAFSLVGGRGAFSSLLIGRQRRGRSPISIRRLSAEFILVVYSRQFTSVSS